MLRIIMEYFPPHNSRVIETPYSRRIGELASRQHTVFAKCHVEYLKAVYRMELLQGVGLMQG